MGNGPTAVDAAQLTDVRLLLVDDDEQWARVTGRLLESAHEAFEVDLADSLSAGRSRFEATDPDCVICDYQLGDGTGLDLLETVRESDADRPFVLVTGKGDEAVASEAIGRGVTDYIPKNHDDTDATLLTNRVTNAVVSARARRQLDRERRGKAAALELLTSTTDIGELSAEFCRMLVEDHGYAGAWIGAVEDGEIVPQAVEGCGAYLDGITNSGVVATDDPVVMAANREESVALSPTDVDGRASKPDSEQQAALDGDWQQLAVDHGFVTAAGVPIRREGVRIGVLGVYRSAQQQSFDERQWTLLEEYARILGYAHRTAELKRSLLADEAVHLDIEITDTTAPIAELTDQLATGVSVEVPSTIEQHDGTALYLTQLSGTNPEAVEEATEACESVDIGDISDDEDGVRCDLYSMVRTPEDVLAANGATVEGTVGVDGTTTISVSLSDHDSVGDVTEALRTTYDDVTVSRVWSQQDRQPETGSDELVESLTERQRSVLRHAYFDGYFEQPRGVSATELATKFDRSRTTMTQHMRTAQRKLFGQLFDQ
ncbi:response regulator [Halohasta litorea]|uniref:Response regulator n=1 Tax=Halohasta litorea TaxID=869891 RepID=A0ABD6D6C2_9EURY|nr:response regulator [Halohasta litorea]